MDGRPTNRGQIFAGQASRSGPLEDAVLIEKIRSGETEAYADLVTRYQDRVFNACWRICGHLEDARDITQDAFLKAFENLDKFRGDSGFYTWLFRIAVNLALSHRRTARRRGTVSLDQVDAAAGTQADGLSKRIAADPGPAESASRTELQGRVAKALQALDDEQRAVIVLRDIEGLDYQQIAEILEIPTGTVKSRLHRARAALFEAVRPAAAD